uniref:MULE transposase domain-containing protein n=1 Tax=Amphimedon queenslandica TaxID=400682 RepID=A0A1X7U555_AMPQE
MREQSYDPILVYKQQGIDQGPEVNNLAKDDMLCIQTEFQKDCATKFGNKVIWVDSTHSTTMYDFLLIMVMVIDNFNEGVPIAWTVTNCEDQSVLVEFFKGLKAKVDDLAPKYFMSNCANQFYNAWVGVFQERPHKLICTRHIDKAWRDKLAEMVETKEKQVKIYHHLRVILEKRDILQFELVLQQFLSYLADDNEEKFLNYFLSNYVTCKKVGLCFLCWGRY